MRTLRVIAAASAVLSNDSSSLSNIYDAQITLNHLLIQHTLSPTATALPPEVYKLSSQLLARSYTSVGRDDEAVEALLRCPPPDNLTGTDNDDIPMLLGLAHTRLQDYASAIKAFRGGGTARCEYHALLTSMKAWQPIDDVRDLMQGDLALEPDATVNIEAPSIGALKELRDTQALPTLPSAPNPPPATILHDSLSAGRRVVPPHSPSLLLRLASINALPCHGPFHALVSKSLDDKRGLHALLQGSAFYPRGAIVRAKGGVDLSDLPEGPRDLIAKRPCSWGGFGVELWPSSTVQDVAEKPSPCDLVVQERVNDLLEVGGGEFSLRLYVVCRDGSVSWSKKCLCKLAPQGGFITNSAFTGDGRRQFEGFNPLAEAVGGVIELEVSGYLCTLPILPSLLQISHQHPLLCDSPRSSQERISHVVKETFARLGGMDLVPPAVAHIPKILGFDFLARKNGELVLIEVNATPGLVARDDSGDEAKVKRAVLEDAWGISSRSTTSLTQI